MAGGYPPQQAQMADPNAPYGVDPKTGIPYSDKQKMIAGGLKFLPLIIGLGGIGRIYAGHIGTGIAQLLTSFICIGYVWSIIDGILILTNDSATDGQGRILRP